MTRSVFIPLILFFSSFCNAQEKKLSYDLVLGKPQDVPQNIIGQKILGHNANGYIVLNHTLEGAEGKAKGGEYIAQYNFQMDLIEQKRIELKRNNEELEISTILPIEDKLAAVISYFDKNKKKESLNIQHIDKNTLEPTGQIKTLCELPALRPYILDTEFGAQQNIDNFEGRFSLVYSNDSSKLLVYHSEYTKRKAPQGLFLWIFDRDLNLLWKRHINEPFKANLFDVKDLAVTNNGEAYLLAKIYHKKKRERRKGKPNFRYLLFGYSAQEQNDTEHVLESNNRQIGSLRLSIDKHSNIICAGFFLIKKQAEGTVFFKINGKTREFEHRTFQLFGHMLRNRKQEKLELPKVKHLHHTTGGELIIIGEEYSIEDLSLPGKQVPLPRPYFTYEDIVVLKLDTTGKTVWAKLIPKQQIAPQYNNLLLSYAIAKHNDRLMLVFNVDVKYKNEQNFRRYTYSGEEDAMVLMYEISTEGKFTEHILFNERNTHTALIPASFEITENNTIMFLGASIGYQMLGKLELKSTEVLR